VTDPTDAAIVKELQARLNERTTQLSAAQAELQASSLGLMQLSTELEDRVASRTLELHALEEQYRSLFEHAAEGIYQATMDGQCVLANAALARILGFSGPRALLRDADAIPDYADPQRRAQFLRELQVDGVLTQFESHVRRSDGTCVWISENARMLRDATGQVTGFTATVEDTTIRRRDEAAQADLKIQETAARAKDEIISTVSHELRTPLNGVIGMIDLLLGTPLTVKQLEYAEAVQQSGESLLVIINDILDVSKMEAGRLKLECIDLSVRTIVEDVVTLFAKPAERKDIETCAFTDPDIPSVLRGDPVRLRQVLTNLVGNAVKFTERGGVSVRAKLERHTEGGVRLRFEVTDTGVGLPPEAEAWLFKPFSQADSSTSRTHGGTGLGLAICKRLAQLMGGDIGVEHHPFRHGTTFWFTVQLGPSTSQQATSVAHTELAGLRVLVVDDNALARTIVAQQLEAAGLTSRIAESGARALHELRSAAEAGAPFRVALLDLHMPHMDGLMCAALIKADPLLAATQLVLLQTVGRADEVAIAQAGISAVLPKPVRATQLLNTLARLTSPEHSDTRSAHWDGVADTRGQRVPARATNKRILVADDSLINRQVAVGLLERAGYAADAVTNGLEAIEALRYVIYDAILMDCEMPELDGYAATARIRQAETGGKRLPIVALTGRVTETDRERCTAAGMDALVAKPIRVDELTAALAAALSGPGSAAAAPIATPVYVVGQAPVDQPSTSARFDRRFVDRMSHDLNTPLNGILGYAELLSEASVGPLTQQQAAYLGELASAGQQLHKLLKTLFDVARADLS
jgi:PAS domain S-box-containing protein